MARQNLYKGYSSFEFEKSKTFTLRDVEIVKLDLLNHIFTQRGTRVMMPTFGTIIPELTFEPLDSDTLDELYDQVKMVLDFDPRIETIKMVIVPDYDTNSVVVEASLFYIELDTVDDFNLNIQFED